ncbi:hypothetical protein AAFF_G00042110 [Aldrovandia affinis]|uniref:Uncharacterized protein n=1 Tax=Aldrovandia affinis TaxID=143900 RepID=A0AAD7WF64_9TELE|nr:hypothetical protein AAFF_G00042110 [Aldrovandia affinis]
MSPGQLLKGWLHVSHSVYDTPRGPFATIPFRRRSLPQRPELLSAVPLRAAGQPASPLAPSSLHTPGRSPAPGPLGGPPGPNLPPPAWQRDSALRERETVLSDSEGSFTDTWMKGHVGHVFMGGCRSREHRSCIFYTMQIGRGECDRAHRHDSEFGDPVKNQRDCEEPVSNGSSAPRSAIW